MGEPRRSPQLSLSSQQLQEGSIYLRQAFLGLAALAQISPQDLVATMSTLASEQSSATIPKADSQVDNPDFGMDGGMNISSGYSSVNLDFSKLSDRLLPPPSNSSGNFSPPLSAPELAFGVRVLVHLCQQHQELIRRAVSLIEQITQEGKDPWQVTLLKDYSQRLADYSSLHPTAVASNQWWGKILFDLLFYSSPHGQQRLWLRCTQPVNIGRT